MIDDVDDERTWAALALRLSVLILPAQLLGALLGFVPTLLVGAQVLTVPWLPSLVLPGMALIAGLAVGLLAHPPGGTRWPAIALAAGFGLAGYAVIALLVRLRLPPGAPPLMLTWAFGALAVVALQSVVVAVMWRRRAAG